MLKHKYMILSLTLSIATLFTSQNKTTRFGVLWFAMSMLSAYYAICHDCHKRI